ncbi:MAG: hypothetical protein IPM43_12450 [Actinomycetota bacterium]|nr:MAG: hypothetical protein IPM43_12450 [Actinomycetota bacterium]
MSEALTTNSSTIDRDDWNAVLSQLRADGFSPVDSIKVTRAVLHVSLGEAKAIVHDSPVWADARSAFDDVHDAAEAAAGRL